VKSEPEHISAARYGSAEGRPRGLSLRWQLIAKLVLYVSLFFTASVTAYLWISSALVGAPPSLGILWFMAVATFTSSVVFGGIWMTLMTCFVELWGKRRWLYPVAATAGTIAMAALLDGPTSLTGWIFGILLGVAAGIGWWRMFDRAERLGEHIV